MKRRCRDTGIGIAADGHAASFQEFKQLDSSTTREYGGTGLGLAICKRSCELMGGTIRVESAAGQRVDVHHGAADARRNGREPPATPVPPEMPATSGRQSDSGHRRRSRRSCVCSPTVCTAPALRASAPQRRRRHRAGAQSPPPSDHARHHDASHGRMVRVASAEKRSRAAFNIPVYVVSIVDNKALAFSLGVTGYMHEAVHARRFAEATGVGAAKASSRSWWLTMTPACKAVHESLGRDGYDVITSAPAKKRWRALSSCAPIFFFSTSCFPASRVRRSAGLENRPSRDNTLVFVMYGKRARPKANRNSWKSGAHGHSKKRSSASTCWSHLKNAS